MLYRLGSAFILLGLIALTVFLVTLAGGQGDPFTLLAGAGLSALGLGLRRRYAPRPEAGSGRFRSLRKLIGSGEREE